MNRLFRRLPARLQTWLLLHGRLTLLLIPFAVLAVLYIFRASQRPDRTETLRAELLRFEDHTTDVGYRVRFHVRLETGETVWVRTNSPRHAHSVGASLCVDVAFFGETRRVYTLSRSQRC